MTKNAPIPVMAKWKGDLEVAYEEAVNRWLAAVDAKAAELEYRRRTFPLACERIRAARRAVPLLELLFVPVGTQPFAPILAVVGNPAACVALLETDVSRPHGLEVERALAGAPAAALATSTATTFLHVRVDDSDLVDIGRQMKAVFDSRGLPSGARVGADITGGRKTMSAAVAGVGSLFGWRLFYVEGVQERGRMGLAHHERVQELANVLDVFGRRRREVALDLLAAGAAGAAASELAALVRESLASEEDRRWLRLAQAAELLRSGEACRMSEMAPGVLREAGEKVPRRMATVLRAARRWEPVEAAAVLWLGAEARQSDGDPLGAQCLAGKACEAVGGELPEPTGGLRPVIREAATEQAFRVALEALEPLARVLGSGLAETVARLR